MKRLLVTGASGFLGWNLIQKAKSDWDVFGVYHSRPINIPDATLFQVDLTDYNALRQIFFHAKPDAVIHTAAVSSPNFCQQNPSETYRINTDVPINIAGMCSELEISCLFTSSDLVFDGSNPPYGEQDVPSPISTYGEQKVKAEIGMQQRYPKTVICRLSLMFGDPGPIATSFIQPLVAALKSGEEVNLFLDEYRTPLSGRHAADGLMIALKQQPSLIHLGGLERISRYELGFLLAVLLGIKRPKINPCKQKDLNPAAPRPPDTSFDCTKAVSLGFQPNSVKDELEFLVKACGW